MENNIKFYMVPASPWSFLSINRLEKININFKLDIDLIPINIIKLFEMHDIKMVSERPLAIQKNRIRELERWKEYLDLPLNVQPKFFPVNPTKACKLIVSFSILYPREKNITMQLAKKLSEAVWVNNFDINNDDVIFKIAEKFVELDKIKEIYFDDKSSLMLEENTKKAYNQDIFGVPTFIFKDKLFWGQDRIFFLEKEIKKFYE